MRYTVRTWAAALDEALAGTSRLSLVCSLPHSCSPVCVQLRSHASITGQQQQREQQLGGPALTSFISARWRRAYRSLYRPMLQARAAITRRPAVMCSWLCSVCRHTGHQEAQMWGCVPQ